MPQANTGRFLWLDLETTCLDPRDDNARILEWAAVLADDDGPACTLEPVEQYTSAVYTPGLDALIPMLGTVVQNMHTFNGLFADCSDPARSATLDESEAFLLSLCLGSDPITLAGSSVHFDLAWLRVHMPKLAARLSHRVLDTSALWLASCAWAPKPITRPTRGDDRPDAHRALPDILQSLADARAYRDAIGWGP